MVFSSLIFVTYFLPAFFLVYTLLPKKIRYTWLLAGSLVFYAWGEPSFLPLMAGEIAGIWALGLWIDRLKRDGKETRAKAVLILGVALLIGLLFWFKYTGFLAKTLKDLFGIKWKIKTVLPLGISFYTFQAISYLADVRRGDIRAARNPLKVGAYIAMFPQLVAGPIVRAGDVMEALDAPSATAEEVWRGFTRFAVGLGKKAILANSLAEMATEAFSAGAGALSAGAVWLGALLYAFQIYFDFSGYSDMAIGMGRMLGFSFPENFNYPYISGSVTEFWRRWHISLSSWFRDYVYIPLGGNRKGAFRAGINRMTVFLLCGLWHGAAWNFVLWGLYYGILLILEGFKPVRKLREKLPRALTWAVTQVFVLVGWVLFQDLPLADSLGLIGTMFGFVPTTGTVRASYLITPKTLLVLGASVLCATPVLPMLKRRLHIGDKGMSAGGILGVTVLCAALLAVSLALIIGGTYNPFIYFRF